MSSIKRCLTWAVVGCTNNDYNLEAWRDSSICSIQADIHQDCLCKEL